MFYIVGKNVSKSLNVNFKKKKLLMFTKEEINHTKSQKNVIFVE